MSGHRIAEYETRCGLCDINIRAGQRIVLVDGEWCHEGCTEDHGLQLEED